MRSPAVTAEVQRTSQRATCHVQRSVIASQYRYAPVLPASWTVRQSHGDLMTKIQIARVKRHNPWTLYLR